MTHTRQGLTPTHVLHDETTGLDLRQYIDHALAAETERLFFAELGLDQHTDRALPGVGRYAHRVFVSREEIEDLPACAPTGLAPLLRADPRILDTQLTIDAHLRRLRARPRRHLPPALLPTLTRLENP